MRTPNIVCPICDTRVYKRPNQIRRGQVFCSQLCYGVSQRRERYCTACGQPLSQEQKDKRRKTCSAECAISRIQKTRQGRTPAVRKDIDDLVDFRRIRVRLMAERETQACEWCGYNECLAVLQVHHILARAAGGTNARSNLAVICPNCHAKHHLTA